MAKATFLSPRSALLVCLAVLLGSMLLGATMGSVYIPLEDLVKMVLNALGLASFTPTWRPNAETIFLQVRLPRVVGAALVGSSLATAGVLFQGLLRNPMADPYVIGVSGGAAVGATLGLMLPIRVNVMGFGPVQLLAFSGAVATVALVYYLSQVAGRTPVVTLLMAGFAVSAILSYALSFLLIVYDRLQLNLRQLYGWLLGGVSVTRWEQVMAVAPLVIVGVLAAYILAYSLNALALGEEGAAQVGVAVERDKRLIIVAGSLLTTAAVTISGLVGFVGLVVPHILRLLLGPDHRLLVPAAALGGGAFLVLADLLARVVLPPIEVPVGILTAFAGGPFFLYLLRRTKKEYLL